MAIDNNADFTPSIPDSGVVPTKLPYNPTGSFKFWAQKVIPLVYDDSLSYYEVLCKVVTYLNNVIQNVDNLNNSVNNTNQGFETLKEYVNTTKDTLINTYNELQDYVNTYFDNLDVQEEINEKLDAMADSGELTTILAPFVPDIVTAWLTTHVNPVGSAVVVDNTLSISGAAADAKVTGDVRNNVELFNAYDVIGIEAITSDKTDSGITYHYANGEWEVSGTASATSTKNIFYDKIHLPTKMSPGNTYYALFNTESTDIGYQIYWYDSQENLTALVTKTSDSKVFTLPNNAVGILITLVVSKNTVIPSGTKCMFYVTNAMSNDVLEAYINNTNTSLTALAGVVDRCVKVDPTATPEFSDADDINIPSIIFASNNGTGTPPNVDNVPYSPGWLISAPAAWNAKKIVLQIMYPYMPNNYDVEYRVKQGNSWTSWRTTGFSQTMEVSHDTYNNTYNITTAPTITTDANGWLQAVDTDTESETDKTDMTGAIMSMLNSTGHCHLAPGIFYVSGNINLPIGATLEGCGNKTIIRLLQSTTSGYIVRVKESSIVKNIRFSGGYNTLSVSSNIGGRSGISYIGNADGNEPSVSPATGRLSIIENCFFENLDSAIYCHNTGGGLNTGLLVDDCYIKYCSAGINIDYLSEFGKYTNIVTYHCYYACINNGGNNTFIGCTFHGTIGMLLNDAQGTSINNGHGIIDSCIFDHIDNWNHPSQLGSGLAISANGIEYGMTITDCQFWYSAVEIINSVGFAFENCVFGGYAGGVGPRIEVTGESPAFFFDCIFHYAPTKTLNTVTKMLNCFNIDGTAVTNS